MQKQGPTKADARAFLRALQDAQRNTAVAGSAMVRPVIREMIEKHGMPEKRCLFLLDKWSARGWYDWSTVVDGGGLTSKGMALEVS